MAFPEQCGNYGLGGSYGVHGDFFPYDPDDIFLHYPKINRVVTVMTILEAPEAGGATAFPYLGVMPFPETGSSVFWFNLRRSGIPDRNTRHAACSVMLGQKWSG